MDVNTFRDGATPGRAYTDADRADGIGGGIVNARERDVAKIVAAASDLFAEHGPARVSLRDIARAAGVNYGLIHQYIGSKDDLLKLVFRSSSSRWSTSFAEAEGVEAAVDYLMRPKSTVYVRMLAHTLLEGRDPGKLLEASSALQELSRRLREEAGADDDLDARIQAAAMTCTAMGWGLFGPFIRVIAGLEDEPEPELTERVYSYVRNAVLGQQHPDQ